MAGNANLSEVCLVIISGTAMDCLAWLKKNYHSFSRLDGLLFLSLGAALQSSHSDWLRSRLKNKKIILLFGRDVLGRITDLKVAAAINDISLEVYIEGDENIAVYYRSRRFLFSPENLSLNALDKASGYRFNLACRKPLQHNTFFDELLDHAGLLIK
ncbi:MAG: hypothetical protein JST19_20460 [Bacteroidetes bacterium]|nr:hypothetical protein [Bacteroidota bacterium]